MDRIRLNHFSAASCRPVSARSLATMYIRSVRSGSDATRSLDKTDVVVTEQGPGLFDLAGPNQGIGLQEKRRQQSLRHGDPQAVGVL